MPGLMAEESRTWYDSPQGLTLFCPDMSAGKGVTAPEKIGVTGLLGKGSACHVPVPATASPRASVQSLVQPRAVRPRRKHEPLQRLEGMLVGRPGLLAALEEVRVPAVAPAHPAVLPPGCGAGSCCYCAKGTVVGWAPEDCPGNMAQEWQQAALLQRRQSRGPGASSSESSRAWGCLIATGVWPQACCVHSWLLSTLWARLDPPLSCSGTRSLETLCLWSLLSPMPQEPGLQTLGPVLGASASASGPWLPSGHQQKPSGGGKCSWAPAAESVHACIEHGSV